MTRNPKKYSRAQLSAIFKRRLTKEEHSKLINFVIVDKLLAHMPGRYVCYRFYGHKNFVACATSEIEIKEWLTLHGQENTPTEFLTDSDGNKIAEARKFGFCKLNVDPTVGQHREQIQEEIMRLLDSGDTITGIAKKMGCTAPNISYHKAQYTKRMAKQLEVDKT
jgi:hypothetical protein